MSNEGVKIEVAIARGVPTVLKLLYLACATVGIYYSLVLDNMLSLGGWVLAFAIMWAYHIMEVAAVSYHNELALLRSLLQIKMLELDETTGMEVSLTKGKDEDGNQDETSTNGE